MSIPLEVKWVDQSGRSEAHQRIRNIGGNSMDLQWHHTQTQAIEAIESNQFFYFIQRGVRGVKLSVGRTDSGEKFLTVLAYDGDPQLLLELPEHPAHAN